MMKGQRFSELEVAYSRIGSIRQELYQLGRAYLECKLSRKQVDGLEEMTAGLFCQASYLEICGLQARARVQDERTIQMATDVLYLAGTVFDQLTQIITPQQMIKLDGQVHVCLHAALCYHACRNQQNVGPVISSLARFFEGAARMFTTDTTDFILQKTIVHFLAHDMKSAINSAAMVRLYQKARSNPDHLQLIAEAVQLLSAYAQEGGERDATERAFRDLIINATSKSLRSDPLYHFITQALGEVGREVFASSVWSLLPHDRAYIKYLIDQKGIYWLWEGQRQALSDGLLDSENVVLCIPASTGKTLLAELKVIRHLQTAGTKVTYLAPTRALAMQVYRSIAPSVRAVGGEAKILLEVSDELDDANYAVADFVVATPEKLELMIRHDKSIVDEIGLVIVDEVHLMGEGERGLKLEFLLMRLRACDTLSLLVLSAVVSNPGDLASWLYATSVSSRWVPTTINIGYNRRGTSVVQFDELGPVKAGEGGTIPELAVAFCTLGTVLVVDAQKSSVEKKAVECHGLMDIPIGSTEALESYQRQLSILLGADHTLVGLAARGITYHHADLDMPVKAIVEAAIRQGLVTIVFATSTLAEGVDFPVRTVIINNLYQNGVLSSKRVLNNVIGRAGRAGYANVGYAILVIPTTWKLSRAKAYLSGASEPLSSVLVQFWTAITSPQTELTKMVKKGGKWVRVKDDAKWDWVRTVYYTLQSYIWVLSKEHELTQALVVEELLSSMFAGTKLNDTKKTAMVRWVSKKATEIANDDMPEEAKNILLVTGFSFISSRHIYDSLLELQETEQSLSLDQTFINWFATLATGLRETRPPRKYKANDHNQLLFYWITGNHKALEARLGSQVKVTDYANKVLKYTWSWLAHTVSKLMTEYCSGGRILFHPEYLPLFVRYGTSDPACALFLELGFDREAAAYLSNECPVEFVGKKAEDLLAVISWLERANMSKDRVSLEKDLLGLIDSTRNHY